MSAKFWNNPEIMALEIPPECMLLDWYPGDRSKVLAHGINSSGIVAIPLTGVMKADNAKKLIEEYEARYKRGEKSYKLINPIETIDLKN